MRKVLVLVLFCVSLGVYGQKLMIDNSYYDYTYAVDLSEARGNMVYLEPPPTCTTTTVELAAIRGGGRSDPYTTNNSAYWDKVIGSATGYAEELTFVIHYRIYLPIVLRGLTP